MEDEEFLALMEKSLPAYAMKCFIYAGYDTSNVVAQMKTIGTDSSLDEIESFILKHYSDDDLCFPPTIVKSEGRDDSSPALPSAKCRPFVFPPGHRIRIIDFINSVKSKYVLSGKKRPSSTTFPAKKQKPSHFQTEEIGSEKEKAETTYDLKEIADDVRKRIIKWQNKQIDTNLGELKEFQHYKVMVNLDSSDQPSVSIFCELCNKTFKLIYKENHATMMISNWTSHIKKCITVRKERTKPAKQQPLSKYCNKSTKLDEPSTSASVTPSKDNNYCAGKDNPLTSKEKPDIHPIVQSRNFTPIQLNNIGNLSNISVADGINSHTTLNTGMTRILLMPLLLW